MLSAGDVRDRETIQNRVLGAIFVAACLRCVCRVFDMVVVRGFVSFLRHANRISCVCPWLIIFSGTARIWMPCLGGAGRLVFMPETLCSELGMEMVNLGTKGPSVLHRVGGGLNPGSIEAWNNIVREERLSKRI